MAGDADTPYPPRNQTRMDYDMPNSMMSGLGSVFNHIDPEHVSNGQLYSLMYAMHAQQLDASREMRELRAELVQHKKDMAEMTDAWKTAVFLIRMFKIFAAIGIPIGLIYGGIKSGVVRTFGGI